MSTFLVSFGVVAAAIAGVVHVVLNAPDQPPTIRRQPAPAKPRRRDRAAEARRQRERKAAAPAPAPAPTVASGPSPLPGAAIPALSGLALPDSDVMRLRVLPAARTTLWVRIRSGVALVVLVAVLGALLALAIGAAILGIALVIRSATG